MWNIHIWVCVSAMNASFCSFLLWDISFLLQQWRFLRHSYSFIPSSSSPTDLLLSRRTWSVNVCKKKEKKNEGGRDQEKKRGSRGRATREVCNNFLQLLASSFRLFLSEREAQTKQSGTGCRLSSVWSWEMGTPLFLTLLLFVRTSSAFRYEDMLTKVMHSVASCC